MTGSLGPRRQSAIFDPVGLGGLAYWYALYPVHRLVFSGILRNIVRVAWQAEPEVLVLAHFSPRYKSPEVRATVHRQSRSLGLRCRVHIVPPGEVVRDVLGAEPLWQP